MISSHIVPMRRVQTESDECIVYGSVARYGPQSAASESQKKTATKPKKKFLVRKFKNSLSTFYVVQIYRKRRVSSSVRSRWTGWNMRREKSVFRDWGGSRILFSFIIKCLLVTVAKRAALMHIYVIEACIDTHLHASPMPRSAKSTRYDER